MLCLRVVVKAVLLRLINKTFVNEASKSERLYVSSGDERETNRRVRCNKRWYLAKYKICGSSGSNCAEGLAVSLGGMRRRIASCSTDADTQLKG